MKTVEPIRNVDDINRLTDVLRLQSERNYVLVMCGLYSGMRISDIVPLKVRDVIGKRIELYEKKTGKLRRFPINDNLRKVFKAYIRDHNLKEYDYLFPSKKRVNRQTGERIQHIGRIAAYQVFKKAADEVGLKNIGTHSMRKTYGYHFYMQTQDIAKLMKIFNHSSPQITLRYIGFEQDELDEAMMNFCY